jgi:triphosphoribosyl-dephospho-CoA synthase
MTTPMLKPLNSAQLADAFHWACMAELQALKPGNVHVFADGHGMSIDDFIKSADASAAVIAEAGVSVGERIFNAVQATQAAVGLNTNLGLILLCAPLIHAALHTDAALTLQQRLDITLAQLSIDDAQLAAAAIVLAKPAGLGAAEAHDVNHLADVSLLEMMAAAQSRDRIAWQYANAYQDILQMGVERYNAALAKWQNVAWATTALHLAFLTHQPDSHIVRKYGESRATEIMHEAIAVEVEYWATDNPKLMQKQLLAWDTSLKIRNINPGTSADLTVACLLATRLL